MTSTTSFTFCQISLLSWVAVAWAGDPRTETVEQLEHGYHFVLPKQWSEREMTVAYMCCTVGRFSLVTDELVEVSKCSRVTMTLRRQLSNARHNHVSQSPLWLSLIADHAVQLHTHTHTVQLHTSQLYYALQRIFIKYAIANHIPWKQISYRIRWCNFHSNQSTLKKLLPKYKGVPILWNMVYTHTHIHTVQLHTHTRE